MTNTQIYKKTLVLSLRRLLWDFGAFLLLGGLCAAGFFLMETVSSNGLIGLGIGLLTGLIALFIILRYVSYTYKAGQIAMMTKGITEGQIPDDVAGASKQIVKERFSTIAVYFAATGAIKGIFGQLGKGLTAIGNTVGGDTGRNIADAVNTAVQVLISYLCDCCLGWVFFRRNQNAAKATCEGAVLFFRHGKTLLKNMGRIFGMGLASLAVIGGAFSGVFYLIFSRFPAFFEAVSAEFAQTAADAENSLSQFIQDPKKLMLGCAVIAGIIIWNILHSTFVRPFILVGVLRNYLESGMQNIPEESSFRMLDGKSAKFAKLHSQLS